MRALSQQDDPFSKFRVGAAAYQAMSKAEIERDMDARYATGRAYPDERIWVDVYHTEVEKIMSLLIRDFSKGKDVLELGCGGAGVAAFNVNDARSIIATDLSEVALQRGREFFQNRPELNFVKMDAESLDLPDRSVDIAIAKEVIEHLPDPRLCMAEIFRVLRPGGVFLLSTPNRDSLHLRLNRKLGHDDFMCSGDHIKEFTFDETVTMIKDAGLTIETTEGVLLMPYHYVKDVFPSQVDALESKDPEFVNWLRILGHRAGPEYTFGFIIVASK